MKALSNNDILALFELELSNTTVEISRLEELRSSLFIKYAEHPDEAEDYSSLFNTYSSEISRLINLKYGYQEAINGVKKLIQFS